ncbi:MAG: hypothetical protein IKK75_03530 [Clostridia bacterium]|nr:hypothetical protein [Clostridia bacterium]
MKKQANTEALLIAIRAKCMDCSGNSRREVERCKLRDCPLWPYRNTRAIGAEPERHAEIDGQINLFEIITTKEVAM